MDYAAALKPIDETITEEQEHPGTGQPMVGIEVNVGETATLVATTDPLDLTSPRAAIKAFEAPLAEMQRAAEALVVDSDKREVQATELGTRANKLAKEVEKRKKEITQDARDFVSAVNNLAKQFTEPATAVTTQLKGKIVSYRQAKELERRKREAAERKAREEAQRKIDEEAKKANVAPVKLPEPVAEKPANVTRTESGSAHGVKTWTFEIEDEAKVPRDYMQVDTKKIGAAVKAGIREIEGVRIFQRDSVSFR